LALHPGERKHYLAEEAPVANNPIRRQPEEDWYRDLGEHSQDLLCTHDLEGRFLSINPAPAHLLGYSVEEVLGKPMRDFIPPQFQAEFDAYLRKVGTTGEAHGLLAVTARSGEQRIWEYSNTLRTEGVSIPIVRGIAHDVTERVRAGKALRTSNQQLLKTVHEKEQLLQRLTLFRAQLDQSNDAIEVIDPETLRFLDVNERTCLKLGYSREELLSMTIVDIDPLINESFVAPLRKKLEETGFATIETVQRRKDGTTFPVEVNIRMVRLDRVYGVAVARDITQRKQAEEALRESEGRERVRANDLEAVLEAVPVGVCIAHGRDCRWMTGNREARQQLRVAAGKNFSKSAPPEEQPGYRVMHDGVEIPANLLPMQLAAATGKPVPARPLTVAFDDGTVLETLSTAVPLLDEEGNSRGAVGASIDLTELKLTEKALRESEVRFRSVYERSPVGIVLVDLDSGRFLKANSKFCEITGRTEAELQNLNVVGITHPDDIQATNEFMNQMGAGSRSGYELKKRFLRPDGSVRWARIQVAPMWRQGGELRWNIALVEDITERRQGEEIRRRLDRELRAISDCNQTLLRAVDEQTLLNDICRIVCDEAGYRMAWVGYVEHDDAKSVRPVAWGGLEGEYLAHANVTWADTERGGGPGGAAIRSGTSICIQDFATDPRVAPWRENALQHGYRSNLAIPLKDERGNTFGELAIYSAEPDAFTPEEIRLLEKLARDLAFGVTIMRARDERKRAEEAIAVLAQIRADSSENFFNSMAVQLAKCLEADHTYIGEIMPAEGKVKTIAVCSQGVIADNVTYDLPHSPCEMVAKRGTLSYVSGATEAFPEDLVLKQLNIEGYIGTPLRDSQGQVIGIMAAGFSRPLENAPFAEMILQMFSTRTAAEIERKRTDDALRESEQRFRVALKNSPIAVFSQDRDLRYTWIYNSRFPVSTSERLGRTMGEPLAPEEVVRLTEFRRRVIETGIGIRHDAEITLDGKKHYLDMTIEPVLDSAGIVIGITGASMDVTRLQETTEALREAQKKLTEEKLYLEQEIDTEMGFGETIGKSQALRAVMEDVRKVASNNATVLLLGETGTGKELVARAVHRLSQRANNGFIKMNCAAIPSGLLESELFGNEKGAFTGAVNKKIGRLELANKGTLFLDEIGELPIELQPKLLRVLQDQEFERLGGNQTLKVDFRLIAATNRDLAEMMRHGKFRSDLYYRLNVFPIRIPPLRERRDDIPLLVEHFVQKFAQQMKKPITSVSKITMDALMSWDWPGNIRELENFIERSVILTQGSVLAPPLRELTPMFSTENSVNQTLEAKERDHILRALRECNGQISGMRGAAIRLGLKRTTLQSKMKRLGIDTWKLS
jgi:formate hydrogenlyase transcriptional activator